MHAYVRRSADANEGTRIRTGSGINDFELTKAKKRWEHQFLSPKESLDSVMGKYAHLKTSSAAFAERKREEIELEERQL